MKTRLVREVISLCIDDRREYYYLYESDHNLDNEIAIRHPIRVRIREGLGYYIPVPMYTYAEALEFLNWPALSQSERLES